MSLINRDDESLYCGHYVSDVFDASTGILWHCDDDNITQVSDIPKVVYIIERHKKTKRKEKVMSDSIYLSLVFLYQNKQYDKIQLYLFSRIPNHVQNQSYEEIN